MSHALGLDPGPSKTAASLIRIDDAGWPHIEIGGHYENDSDELRRLIQRAAMLRAPVGVETICGFAYEAKRVAALVETARIEGRLHERALVFGAAVVQIEARIWRGQLCGSPTASDKQIRIAIEGLCKTIPLSKAAEREHLYDATGVAIAVIALSLGRVVSVPARVMALIHQQREIEKVSRGARKAAGLEAVEPKKRSRTRAQTKRRGRGAVGGWI